MFSRVHCNLCEHGSMRCNMQDMRKRKMTRTMNVEERVLQSFEDHPNTSTRDSAQRLGVCQSAVRRIVPEQGVHPYHLKRVQLLHPNVCPKCVDFAQWFTQKGVGDPSFSASVPFTEEALFSRERVFNAHNSQVKQS
ncbi:uncharacterized protein TNCV_2435891 [Trichonephila clavipes]|nr:uncharacterized protein TNCV_2435891 [Trichonephila clavipes]